MAVLFLLVGILFLYLFATDKVGQFFQAIGG